MSMPVQPFDVAGLRDALPVALPMAAPAPAAPVQRAQMDGAANVTWSADFLARQSTMVQTRARTPTQAHVLAHRQTQAIPATLVEMQQDRMQNLTSPMGEVHSASLMLVRQNMLL